MMAAFTALTLALTAVLPALAIVEDTKETFSGSAVGDELVLVSDEGPSCHGRLSLGLLTCSDGRTGQFAPVKTHLGWLAYGTLDGQDLTITIG